MADREKNPPSYDAVIEGLEGTGSLIIGNRAIARDMDLLKELGVTHVVNATSELRNYFEKEPNFSYFTVPVMDTDHSNIGVYFDDANKFMHEAIITGHTVLVHCQQGVSRSASICVAYLIGHENKKLVEAYTQVKKARSTVKVRSNFLKQLVNWETNLNAKRRDEVMKNTNDEENKDGKEGTGKKRKAVQGPTMPPSKASKAEEGNDSKGDDKKKTYGVAMPPKKTYGVMMPPGK